MGVSFSSTPDRRKKLKTLEGKWSNFDMLSPEWQKKWVTKEIKSDKDTVKMDCESASPLHPCEIWGPYDKRYTFNYLKQYAFTPPEKVDGIPLLCNCSDIPYIRFQNGLPNLGKNLKPLACWYDSESFYNPYLGGSDIFFVKINDPLWFINLDNSFFSGGRIKKNNRKTLKKRKT